MTEASTRMVSTVFHADLSDGHSGEDYWVSVSGKRHPLILHTPSTLASAYDAAPHLKAGREGSTVTHYCENPIMMPVHSVIRVHLRHSQRTFPNAACDTGVGLSALFLPPHEQQLAAMPGDAIFHAHPIDYTATAQSFLFHHADLINKNPAVADKIINGYMIGDKTIAAAINQMALVMRKMGPSTEAGGWAKLVPFQTHNDDPAFNGVYDNKTFYTQNVSEEVQAAAFLALAPLLIRVKNDLFFENLKWTVTPGSSVVSAPSAPAPNPMAARGVAEEASDQWNVAVANAGTVCGLAAEVTVADSDKQQVSISLDNSYIRYLGAYIRFYDAKGDAIKVPNWEPDDAGAVHYAVAAAGLQYDDVRFLGILSPINNVFAIPIPPHGALSVKATFPANAVSASVYGSGLGTGANPWPLTPALGGSLTGVFNLGVPAFMLGFGVAAQTYKPLYDIIQKLAANKGFVAGAVLGFLSFMGGSSWANKSMNWTTFTTAIQFLFDTAVTKALVWVEGTLAAEEAAEQIPFAGWIMLAINIATGIAQLAETIIEVATSDWNIEHKIATTITTQVKVHPDPRSKSFPQGGASEPRSLIVKMIYKDQKRPTVRQVVAIPDGSTAQQITASFAKNTLGGQVSFEADFFVGDWLAGKATTGEVPNDAINAREITMYLVEYPIPLTDQSIYAHARILTYNGGAYGWTDRAAAPTATIADKNTSPTGNALGGWTGLALNQRTGMLGSAWQAAGMGIADCVSGSTGQLQAFMNLNIPGTPMESVKFPSCGFTGQTRLIYDPYPPKFKQGADGQWIIDPRTGRPVPADDDRILGNYYVDPRSALLSVDQGGGYHLRAVKLDNATPFDMASGQKSFGRFAYFPDSVCLHPSGMIVGVSARYQKLQIVTLNKEGGGADADVPLGAIGAGPALDPIRPGLMFFPVSVACAYDGTILVLEDTKSSTGATATIIARLSAYDLNMNPVNRFNDAAGKPSPWLYLADAENNYYLDMAVVGDDKMTYIYVLYYKGSGASPTDYNMAIYTYGKTVPETNPLVTTNAIAAARLAVDMWHSAYTLNFAMVTDAAGKPAGPANGSTGPAGRTVPSISMWLPPTPKG